VWNWVDTDEAAMVGAVVGPMAVAGALVPLREDINATNAALVMMVVVVGIAASGRRLAGVVAAVSATLSFDFFLVRPYHTFSISNRSDVETAALLLVVGVAVSELAAWGRHRQAEAVRRAVSIAGIGDAVSAMSADDLGAPRVEFACAQLVRLLDLTAAAYISRPPERGTVHLRSDGQVEVEGTFCDVEHYGLPVGRDIELDVVDGLGRPGRFVLRAGPALSPLPGATPGRRGRGALGGRGAGAPLEPRRPVVIIDCSGGGPSAQMLLLRTGPPAPQVQPRALAQLPQPSALVTFFVPRLIGAPGRQARHD